MVFYEIQAQKKNAFSTNFQNHVCFVPFIFNSFLSD